MNTLSSEERVIIEELYRRYTLTRIDLCLKLRNGGLFGPIIDNAVDHAVVVLHCHFSRLQIIFGLNETRQLLEAHAVAVARPSSGCKL